jgi:uncharacterized protein (DUF2236 family)
MTSSQLNQVRRKFVSLMRSDPPPPVMGLPREPLAPIFDRWVARHFSADEVAVLFELEHQYGERAMADWFAEVLFEAGQAAPASMAS